MIDNEIVGGVSPLKKRRSRKSIKKQNQKRDIKGKKAGKHGMLNTRTKRGGLLGRVLGGGRGGFSKAGAAGENPHGYGSRTRFKYNKAAAGPLAPATSSKTGPTSGGGGPNPYPVDSGDTIYNTTTTDNSKTDNRQDNRSYDLKTGNIEEGDNVIKSNNKNISKQNNKSNQKSKTKSSGGGFAEACRPNGKRLPSGSIGTDSKGKRFKCVWDPNYKPRAKSKNTQRSKNTNKNEQVIENPQSIDNSGRTNDTSIKFNEGKSVLNEKSILDE